MGKLVKHIGDKKNIGRVVFTSCSTHEKLVGIDEFKHGLFTYFLLIGLKWKNNEPDIEILELIKSVRENIISYSIAHHFKQTPINLNYIQGEFRIPKYNPPLSNKAIFEMSELLGISTKSLWEKMVFFFKKNFYLFPWHKYKVISIIFQGVFGISFIIAVLFLFIKFSDKFGSIEEIDATSNTIIAFDSKGNNWRKYFDSKISRYSIADFDKDGEKDVLVGFASSGIEGGCVIAFNRLGDEKWRYRCTSIYPYPKQGKGELGVFDVNVFLEKQEPVIAVLFGDQAWFQSVFVMLNKKGEHLKELWHSGHLRKIVKLSNIYIISAYNNDLRITNISKRNDKNFSVLFGIKFENIYGQAPPYFGNALVNNKFEWYYILSDQEETWGDIVPLRDKIRVIVTCGLVLHFDEFGNYTVGKADDYSCKEALKILKINFKK